VNDFLFCAGKSLSALEADIHTLPSDPSTVRLVVIDALHPLLASPAFNLPSFLALLASPTTSILALCHNDIPLTPHDWYAPHPMTYLRYVATTIITTHSLPQIIAAKEAQDRCVAAPRWGLAERVPGALVGRRPKGSAGPPATVLEMEHRRRSGRAVRDWFVVEHGGAAGRGAVARLEDHPAYPRPDVEGDGGADTAGPETTFNLGLSEKERRDREGVRLPYMDAQREGGIGEGGRILYDMGVEDDFDDEEDEI
jgi:elongator complex protein 5